MDLNISSKIVLNKVSENLYKPEMAVERSEITRYEKIPTEIFPTVDEGAKNIANYIESSIKRKQRDGKFCVIGLGTGLF